MAAAVGEPGHDDPVADALVQDDAAGKLDRLGGDFALRAGPKPLADLVGFELHQGCVGGNLLHSAARDGVSLGSPFLLGPFQEQPFDRIGVEQEHPLGFDVRNAAGLGFIPQPADRDAKKAGPSARLARVWTL